MNKSECIKRYFLLVVGLFISGFGVAITKVAALGVSPISSVANVMSIEFSNLSLGTWIIIWNFILITGQILILKKNFRPIQFLQIPVSFLFGYFTDFGMWCLSIFTINTYIMQLAMVLLGVVTLGLGITIVMKADIVMNSGEAFVKAIADTVNKEFGNVKIVFDISCVIISVTLSLVFFDFSIVGIREGTVITALCTGIVIKFFSKNFGNKIQSFILA